MNLLMFICILRVHMIIAVSLNKIKAVSKEFLQPDSSIDCSKFKTDDDILDSLISEVKPNQSFKNTIVTYNTFESKVNVEYLKIINGKYIPFSIFCFKHLKELDIKGTPFYNSNGNLPVQIERFASTLTDLSIDGITITHLPEQVGKLINLKSLQLSNTGLESLPDSIGHLPLLKVLYLPNNNLTSLPTTIVNTRSLWQLVLNDNPYLRSIKSLNGHPSLKVLQTNNCPIENNPIDLPNLTSLQMSNNNLTRLNNIESLGNGTDYEKFFSFDMNHIKLIPLRIFRVKKLHTLNVNHNQLTDLPSTIYDLSSLRRLHIRNNHFSTYKLNEIVNKFKITNPSLNLSYITKNNSLVKMV